MYFHFKVHQLKILLNSCYLVGLVFRKLLLVTWFFHFCLASFKRTNGGRTSTSCPNTWSLIGKAIPPLWTILIPLFLQLAFLLAFFCVTYLNLNQNVLFDVHSSKAFVVGFSLRKPSHTLTTLSKFHIHNLFIFSLLLTTNYTSHCNFVQKH
jgi:hypothetical protein